MFWTSLFQMDFSERMCRLCLTTKSKFISVFQNVFEKDQLSERIVKCVSIEIEVNDNLPSFICKQCLKKLDEWYDFRKMCIESDKILRLRIKNNMKEFSDINLERLTKTSISSYSDESDFVDSKVEDLSNDSYINNNTNNVNLENSFVDEYNKDIKEVFDCISETNSKENSESNKCISEFKVLKDDNRHHVDKICENKGKQKSSAYCCDICGKYFNQTGDLIIHKRIHSGERPYICEVCGKSFHSSSNLARHKKIHIGDKPYACMHCPKWFSVRSSLKEHEKLHSGKKGFLCTECGKSFAQKGNLKTHEMLHTGERPWSCKICGKSFTVKGNLKDHFNVHLKEKPFSCNYCTKKFSQKSSLNEHQKVHNKERPFSCVICEKTFGYRKTLKLHMNIHTKEKQFVCHNCGKLFNELGHLKRHLKTHSV